MAFLATVASVLGLLALSSAPALAAATEPPETVSPATAITATSATLHGVLNPGKAGEPGSYQFSYAHSASECAPGILDPAAPAFAAGAEKEEESVAVAGLEPNQEYAFCLIAYSLSSQPSQGAPVPFKTLPLPPEVAVGSERTSGVGASGATLEAQVNPNNEATGYVFEYSTEEAAGELKGSIVKVDGSEPANGFSPEGVTVSVPTEALNPGTTYYFRVVAENEQSKTEGTPATGTVTSFTTVPAAHTEPATLITAETATLNGVLTPLNETPTKYFFEYAIGGGCGADGGTPLESAGTGSGPEVVSVAVTGLQPSQEYSVCLVALNVFGSERDQASPQVRFVTLPAPPKVDGEGVSGVSSFEATLEAQVNPDNQETNFSFVYGTSPTLAGASTLKGSAPLTGFGDQTASAPTGHALAAGTTYHYRVIAENAAHEKTEGEIKEFVTPALAPPIVEGESTRAITAHNAGLEAQVNPSSQETTYSFEYATKATGETLEGAIVKLPGGSIPAGTQPTQAGPVYLGKKLAPATTYYYRVVATNEAGSKDGPVESFTTLIAPLAGAAVAQNVTATTATLSEGTVNPLGVETTYRYAYVDQQGYETGLEKSPENPYLYGRSTPEAPAGAEVGAKPTEPVQIGSLAPGTLYHYAIIATNTLGSSTVGPDQTFTTSPATLPALTGASVTNITQSAATIAATIEAKGEPTRWELQLGTSPGNLRYEAAGRTESAGAEPISVTVEPLTPGATYYYKFIAINPDDQAEPAATPEGSFSTAPASPTTALVPVAGTPLLTIPNNTFPEEEKTTPSPKKKTAKCPKGKQRKHGKCVKAKAKHETKHGRTASGGKANLIKTGAGALPLAGWRPGTERNERKSSR